MKIINITGKTTPEEFMNLYNYIGSLEMEPLTYYMKKKLGLIENKPKTYKFGKPLKDMTREEYSQYRKDYYQKNKEKIKKQSREYWNKKNKNN